VNGLEGQEGRWGVRPTKRQLSALQTRARLLAVALDEFSRRPYAEVTVGDIAKSAGVAQGLLSHHFGGKPGLYLETLCEIARQLAQAQSVDPDASPGDGVRQHLRGHLRFVAEHEDAARNLILSDRSGVTEAGAAFDAMRSRGLGMLCERLGLDLQQPAVHQVMWSFASCVDGLTRQWLDNRRRYDVDALVAAIVEQLKGAIQGIHALDPSIEVTKALALLDR
jgi:AcrR family transcriptional regulator